VPKTLWKEHIDCILNLKYLKNLGCKDQNQKLSLHEFFSIIKEAASQ